MSIAKGVETEASEVWFINASKEEAIITSIYKRQLVILLFHRWIWYLIAWSWDCSVTDYLWSMYEKNERHQRNVESGQV